MKRIIIFLIVILTYVGSVSAQFAMTCNKGNGGTGVEITVTGETPLNRFYLYQWEFNGNVIDSIFLPAPVQSITFRNVYAGNYGVRGTLYSEVGWDNCWTVSEKITVTQPPLFWFDCWELGVSCEEESGVIRFQLSDPGGDSALVVVKNQLGEIVQQGQIGAGRSDMEGFINGRYFISAVDANGCYNSPTGSRTPLDIERAGTGAFSVDLIDRMGTCARDDGYIIVKARYITGVDLSHPRYDLYRDEVYTGKTNITGIFEGLPEGVYQVQSQDMYNYDKCKSTSQEITLFSEETMDIIIDTEMP